MSKTKKAFTLIELIIVVVIIGILALVAIPRYLSNIAKSQRNAVFANIDAIRRAQLSYYAVYGTYKGSFPINVTIDGETIVDLANLSDSNWRYVWDDTTASYCAPDYAVRAYKQPGDSCYYYVCIPTGNPYEGNTCP
jgi:prepilin-type N-terminal cleavage/methylation domain-containing protein